MNLRDHLLGQGVGFDWFLHRPQPGASRFAHSVGVSGARVAKAVLLQVGGTPILAVLPATRRVDLAAVGRAMDARDVRLATEDETARLFHDCERGAIPPFGRLYGIPSLLDESMDPSAEIVCVGNQRHEAIRMRLADLEAMEGPARAAIGVDAGVERQPPSHRRAG